MMREMKLSLWIRAVVVWGGGVMMAAGLYGQEGRVGPLTTVGELDLRRYAGVWFEQARTPNWFQKKCAKEVRVTYDVRPDGKISVVNQCLKANGETTVANGTAKKASNRPSDVAKLKVSFFWPFSGDYWVIGLDSDYRWAVVGEPDRKYLWLLTREQKISDAVLQQMTEVARLKGYDPKLLVRTSQ